MSDWWAADPVANGGAPAATAGGWWHADPPAPPAPEFGSDPYISALAKKHGADPEVIRGLVNSQAGTEGVKGIPILGGLTDKAGAGISALAAPLTGAGVPGASIGDRYTKNLALEKEIASDFEAAHPNVAMAANLAGGLTSTAPLAATGLGAKLLGLSAKTLPGSIAAGAASGSGINAADAYVRGEDPGTAALVGGGLGAALPVAGRVIGNAITGARNLARGPVTGAPANTIRVGGVDVPVSSGQATGDVATQMMENTALRGGEGQGPQHVAEQFFNGEQKPAVERARDSIGRGFDQFGMNVADNPQTAGEIVGDSVRNIADQSKQNYKGLYDTAMSLPGEIHAGAFEGIGQKIKGDLTLGKNPVIIDDVTTPIASRAIQDIDNTISQLKIQNRADPFGAPNPENITGVNLAGVDQVRKRLVSMASSAEPGSADRRAVGRVIGAFDNHVEDSIANGLFTGDDRALDALRDARAAYSQHQKLFRQIGPGDDVGRAMERIVGRNGQDGATPTEVANYLYGSSRVGGTGLSVRLGERMQKVLGSSSPEWSAIRQGLWSRLTAATEGTTEMGPQKIAGRISEFLNGSGKPLAESMFSPRERQAMSNFAALQRQLTPKPGTVNFSNTAPVARMLVANAMKSIPIMLGAEVAGPVGALAGVGVNAAGKALTERSAAGRVARSLYQTPAQNSADASFARQMSRHLSLGGRMVSPMLANQAQQQN